MPEEKDIYDGEPGCDTDPDAKPTITIAEREVPRPTIIEDEEVGDVGVLNSPDGWVNPWEVKEKNKP